MDLQRYHRQLLLPQVGEEGQRRLASSHALIVGCGALGSCQAEILARAGVGRLTLVDRDCVELTNLQRQVLFREQDAREGVPKAQAAKQQLKEINSDITVGAVVDDFNFTNAERLALHAPDRVNVILDGLDNFQTRYLLNDLAVKYALPYVYGGAVSTQGMMMPVLPIADSAPWETGDSTPCLRCIFEEEPAAGTTPTCDTAGVLSPVVILIASLQAAEAIKILLGKYKDVRRTLFNIDIWSNRIHEMALPAPNPDCHCCGRRDFTYLVGERNTRTTSLCGTGSVQVTPTAGNKDIDLSALAERLAPHGVFELKGMLLRGTLENEKGDNGQPCKLTVFPNGRTIVNGISDPARALTIHARYIGA